MKKEKLEACGRIIGQVLALVVAFCVATCLISLAIAGTFKLTALLF